jgi:hypothetical protein
MLDQRPNQVELSMQKTETILSFAKDENELDRRRRMMAETRTGQIIVKVINVGYISLADLYEGPQPLTNATPESLDDTIDGQVHEDQISLKI